jgi:hypothetical protein
MSFVSFETEKELIQDLKIELGEPVVRVELDESQWDRVVKKSKRWFFAKKSVMACKTMRYNANQDPIPFEDIDSVNGVYKILDVYPDATDSGARGHDSTYFELLPFGYPIWGSHDHVFGTFAYNRTSYVFQVYESLERRRRMYGADMDWFVKEDHINGKTLHLTPQNRCRQFSVLYKPKVLPLQALEGRDAQLFFEWALAEAKEILGTIRSKYKDYPAAGGSISTDGPELLDQAKEAKERLTEEIADSQGPMMPIFG